MKVRLKRDDEYYQQCFTMFQFHEGPIKTTYTLPFVDYNVMFQFHEGPIKTKASSSERLK